MTKAQLTTVLLYLRNAHTFIDTSSHIAKDAGDDATAARLNHLLRLTQDQISHIREMREAPNGEFAAN